MALTGVASKCNLIPTMFSKRSNLLISCARRFADGSCNRTTDVVCEKKTFEVIMVRHGQSEWNDLNLFTGWYDSKLTEKGIQEAISGGEALNEERYKFDIAFTSVLTRAIHTLKIILDRVNQPNLKVVKSWRLNERHYGALTGLNKEETAQKYGDKKVQMWRRSYDIPPPPMTESHKYYKTIVEDPRYANELPKEKFPMFESLKLTLERTLPFWDGTIVKKIKADERVLVVAHGNSLRGIVKKVQRMSEQDIIGVNLPTGIPFRYVFDEDMKLVEGMQFLGDSRTVRKAMDLVAKQGKAKKPKK